MRDLRHQYLRTFELRHDQRDTSSPRLRADFFGLLSHGELAQPPRLIDADRTEDDPAGQRVFTHEQQRLALS